MVDRAARDIFAEKLRHFVNGRISHIEFDRAFEELPTTDGAVSRLYEVFQHEDLTFKSLLVPWRDDPHYLRGSSAVTGEARRLAARAIVFLHSDVPDKGRDSGGLAGMAIPALVLLVFAVSYWFEPVVLVLAAGMCLFLVVGFLVALFKLIVGFDPLEQEREKEESDIWPFETRGDYDAALRRPRLLAGVS